jgi:membrane-associated phospholipid phosphatase
VSDLPSAVPAQHLQAQVPVPHDQSLRPGDEPQRSALEAPPGSAAERLGRRWSERSPVLVFSLTIIAGYVALAALMVGLGFVLVDAVLPFGGIGRADESVNEWLASHRSARLDDASYVGSSVGDIPFIPAVVIVTALGAACLRRWRVFAFVVGAILVEVATYRLTSLIVHRQRPAVPRLDPDHLPVNQSYPSGHVAAAVVVYVGLALLLSARIHGRRARNVLWILAIALPLAVALSRLYRGMHHPIDTTAGVLMGLAAITIVLFATRAAGEAARVRSSSAEEGKQT